MTISVRRRIRKAGSNRASSYINVPSPVKTGEEVTIAVDRILIADPLGKIPKEDLHEFMEEFVEPAFWEWRKGGVG
ncbi:hypothetical protein AKJ57_05345 [candidate division MSBL1 archaeon SCGC-AAA259A05]|uniref:Uncharacterized protein n=1 Tax=candidate division MSBL1 archaeon SCGC-AAA259A05 TaxID=1698259 RepID=A0A133U5F7_9EURY|nr:hypothetical protein AKJ57_05345 [candidate division MSBL1 archaeon SCGC-AAA259A05]